MAIFVRTLREDSPRLGRGSPVSHSLRQILILVLEILKCIPVVKILIFLDHAKTISFLDGHYLILGVPVKFAWHLTE